MDEYQLKVRRLFRLEAALLVVGWVGFSAVRGLESGAAFAMGGMVSLVSLLVLTRAVGMVSGGVKMGWAVSAVFVGRLILYAWALSAIIKVYPSRSAELATGVFLSVAAILIEALIETRTHA